MLEKESGQFMPEGIRFIGKVEKIDSEAVPREVPEKITDSIIANAELPEDHLHFPSSMVEDFIVDRSKEGKSKEEITDSFFSGEEAGKLEAFLGQINAQVESTDWQEILPQSEIDNIKKVLTDEMEKLGYTQEERDKIRNIEVDLHKGSGASRPGKNEVNIKLGQILRKAADLKAIFGYKYTQAEVTQAIARNIIAHEIGHIIDELKPSKNKITWPGEEPKERAAEYWGRLILDSKTSEIVKSYLALQTRVVRDNWQQAQRNSVNLANSLWAIAKKADPSSDTRWFVEARLSFYRGNAVENYALPYSRDDIIKGLKKE